MIKEIASGQCLGKYEIKKVLGHGGFGIVYLAEDIVLRKKWAIKQIIKSGSFIIEEALVMKDLDHIGIPRITEQIEDEQYYYIVMDYCKGESLKKYCCRNKVTIDEIIDWGIQLCEILTYLHTQKPPVIFRDMKPGNIIIGENGQLKLIDFGIAKTEIEKDARGTKGFAAPEQYAGIYSISSDIYNLGATLAWCSKDMRANQLKRIIKKAISKNVKRRYKDSRQFKKKLLHQQKKRKQEKRRIRFWIVLMILLVSVGSSMLLVEYFYPQNMRYVLFEDYCYEIVQTLNQNYFEQKALYIQRLQKKKEILEIIWMDGNEFEKGEY